MDFSVLSRYDDILADYFVDNLYLWYNTLRMNGDFIGTNVDKKQAVDLIRDHVVYSLTSTSLKTAVEAFLSTTYFQEYTKDFESKQLMEFSQHMKRYLIMYRHNAGFEVGSTARYTGKPEACLIATKAWSAGEQVTCCLGSIAALSEQDDLKLKREGRDFSVMVSTRKKCSCLFLGPARFMNHDCDSNCEFILIGQNAITFRVIKDIMIGEEMTVFYADHYFGEDNCECLCVSCERMQEGHFSPSKSATTSPEDSDAEQIIQNETSGSRRSGRKRKEINYKDYYVPGQIKRARPLLSESESKTNVKPMLETTNILHNPKENDSINDYRNTTIDDKFKCEKLDSASSWSHTAIKLDQPQSIINYGELNRQLQRAASAPPRFNFMNHENIENLDITQIHNNTHENNDVDIELEMFKDWLDNISEVSEEEFSDAPQLSKDAELTCCDNWREFCMSRVIEEPGLCGRCNRHYQIYGMHWPIRKVKSINGKFKNKGSLKSAIHVSVSLPPSPSPEKEIPARVTPVKPSKKPIPRIRYKVAAKLAKTNNPGTIKRKLVVPSAASYETEPVIISARTSNLSIPNIHTNNLPVHYKYSERSLAIEMQDKLNITKPLRRVPNTPYNPICLNTYIQNCEKQLEELQERRNNLRQLRDRLHHAIYSQPQNNETLTTIQYIPTPEPIIPQLKESTTIDVFDTEIDTNQSESCASEFELEDTDSEYLDDINQPESCTSESELGNIDSEYLVDIEEITNMDEVPPSLDSHNDTASPASITTPINTFNSEDKKSNDESSEPREMTATVEITFGASTSTANLVSSNILIGSSSRPKDESLDVSIIDNKINHSVVPDDVTPKTTLFTLPKPVSSQEVYKQVRDTYFTIGGRQKMVTTATEEFVEKKKSGKTPFERFLMSEKLEKTADIMLVRNDYIKDKESGSDSTTCEEIIELEDSSEDEEEVVIIEKRVFEDQKSTFTLGTCDNTDAVEEYPSPSTRVDQYDNKKKIEVHIDNSESLENTSSNEQQERLTSHSSQDDIKSISEQDIASEHVPQSPTFTIQVEETAVLEQDIVSEHISQSPSSTIQIEKSAKSEQDLVSEDIPLTPPFTIHVEKSAEPVEEKDVFDQSEVTSTRKEIEICSSSEVFIPQNKEHEVDLSTDLDETQGGTVSDSTNIANVDQFECKEVISLETIDDQTTESPVPISVHKDIVQVKFNDSPSPTFTEVLEYAVSPVTATKTSPLRSPSPITLAEEIPAVKQEVMEETLYPINNTNALEPDGLKKAVSRKKGKFFKKLHSSTSDVTGSSELPTTSNVRSVTPEAPLDFESIVNSEKPFVHTSLLPDLSNILNKPTNEENQPSIDFLTIVNGSKCKDYTSIPDSQMAEQYSFMSTIAALRSEQAGNIYHSYHTPPTSLQNCTQPTAVDNSYPVPNFENIINQRSYESTSSNNTSHSSNSPLGFPHVVKREFDNEEYYRNILRHAAERNSDLANQAKLRQQAEKEKNQNQNHYVETHTEYQALPSFQDIVSQNYPQYMYPCVDRYKANHVERTKMTSPRPSSRMLDVTSLLSQEQHNDTSPYQISPIPSYDNIVYGHSEKSFEHSKIHDTPVVKSENTTHFQQPPMKVSFLLQSKNDEGSTEDLDIKVEPNLNMTLVSEQPRRRVSPRKRPLEEKLKEEKVEEPATTRRSPKVITKPNDPKVKASKAKISKAKTLKAKNPRAGTSKSSTSKLEVADVANSSTTIDSNITNPKKKVRVGCPIAPPQRDPNSSTDKLKKPIRPTIYNGIDLLNPPVPRNTPPPSLSSMRTHYSRASKPYTSK